MSENFLPDFNLSSLNFHFRVSPLVVTRHKTSLLRLSLPIPSVIPIPSGPIVHVTVRSRTPIHLVTDDVNRPTLSYSSDLNLPPSSLSLLPDDSTCGNLGPLTDTSFAYSISVRRERRGNFSAAQIKTSGFTSC